MQKMKICRTKLDFVEDGVPPVLAAAPYRGPDGGESSAVTQALVTLATLATNTQRMVVRCRAMAAKAARKCTNMNPFLLDDGQPAAAAAMALHRQEEDGGPVNTVGAATDKAIGQERLLDMVGSRFGDGTTQCRQHSREPEQSAATRIMGVPLAAHSACFPALALNGGGCILVDVMMSRSVAVHVNVDLKRRDLLGNFVETIGRDGTVRERQRNRRHDDARKVSQRHKGRNAACSPAGHHSKHRITAPKSA